MRGSVRTAVMAMLALLLLGTAVATGTQRITPTIVNSLASEGNGNENDYGSGSNAVVSVTSNYEQKGQENMQKPKIVKSLTPEGDDKSSREDSNENVITVTRPTVHVQAVPTVTMAATKVETAEPAVVAEDTNNTDSNATTPDAEEPTPCGCTKAATIVPKIKSKCSECDTCEQYIKPKIVDGCGNLGKSSCDPIDSIEQFYYEAYTDEQLKKALSDIEGAMAQIYKHVSAQNDTGAKAPVYKDQSEIEGDTIFPATKEESKTNQTLQGSGASRMPAENRNSVVPIDQADTNKLVQLAINASRATHADPYWNRCYDTWKLHGLNSTWFSRTHTNFTKL